MRINVSDNDTLWTFDPPILTGIVTPIDVLPVKCLYKRSFRAGAWERGAVVVRASMVDGSKSAMKLDGLDKA